MTKKAIRVCALMVFLLCNEFIHAQQGHFKIRNDEFIQIGYDNYKTLTFGEGISTPNNGRWGIEHWNGGFNIWKPWPGVNYGNYKLFINYENDFVGIGKFPTVKLDVNGDAKANGVLLTSDLRLKTNIVNLNSESCLTKLMNVQSISYNLKYDNYPYEPPVTDVLTDSKKQILENKPEDTGAYEATIKRHGFVAQDLKEVFPDLVRTDNSGFYSVDYIGMIPILVEAVKEQQVKIEALEAEIKELRK